MAFINKNIAQGLSFVNTWDQDIENSIRNEEMDNIAKQKREAKVNYYAEITKEGKAFDSYNNNRLESYFEGLNDDMADFRMNNPNFETNVDQMREYRSIARKYQDNPFINESRKVDEQFKAFQDNYQKNPNQWTDSEYENEMDRYLGYVNQDHENGESVDPYYFSPPTTITFSDIITEQSKIMGLESSIGYGTDAKGNKYSFNKIDVSDESLEATSNRILMDEKSRSIAINAWENTFSEEGVPGKMYPDIMSFLEANLKATKNLGESGRKADEMDLARRKQQLASKQIYNAYESHLQKNIQRSGYSNGMNLDGFTSAGKRGGTLAVGNDGYVEMYTLPAMNEQTGRYEIAKTSAPITQFGGSVTQIGTSAMIEDETGNRFVKINITMDKPNTKPDITGFTDEKEYYKSLGLEVEEFIESNVNDEFSMLASMFDKTKVPQLTGTVLVPAVTNEATITDYNLGYTTKDKVGSLGDQYSSVTGNYNPSQGNAGLNTFINGLNSNFGGKWGKVTDNSTIPSSILASGGGENETYFKDNITKKYSVYRNGYPVQLGKSSKDARRDQ